MSNNIKETVADLRNCTAFAESRVVDWSEARGVDFDEPIWEAFELIECEGCEADVLMTTRMGSDEHRHIQPEMEDEDGEEIEVECDAHLYFDGPQMNYFYPCPFSDTETAARAIAHLPLCVIEFADGEVGFALTGGGMDLSWEICEAYIRCGFVPPFQYTDLPRMAGKYNESHTGLVLAACQRTCDILTEQAMRRDNTLKTMAAAYDMANDL